MGTLSAEQWGCQAWLLLSKSSSRAHWGAQILQSNRRLLLEPAGDVMQLVGKGGQPIRCGPWPVSPVACRRVAWQQQAERLGQRSFRTLSGPRMAGHGIDFLRLKSLFVLGREALRPSGVLHCGSRSPHECNSYSSPHLLLKTHASCQVDLPPCKLVGAFLRASNQGSVKLIKWHWNWNPLWIEYHFMFLEYSIMFWYTLMCVVCLYQFYILGFFL